MTDFRLRIAPSLSSYYAAYDLNHAAPAHKSISTTSIKDKKTEGEFTFSQI